ncbi:MAG: bifunctional demethylmenaquinone methyltransferase/2-methoxy-6-polyprenyl-1,4-benzoquinol methylase UbiE [Rhodothermales bacterium]|nr:bifunctional demethylmenaquinone methyltransferase/2-methoxy-6-polyprenyl-1,4-benzoquinol methylase UbiE [Rhodothermales bacterium]MBO6781384.1 bifunctional demethylmenaquinone methyltransferase/2-methoxy-6-polyprenyl-1,4-benzoquinol methylase UbiE [Rhodothermales bacterium]
MSTENYPSPAAAAGKKSDVAAMFDTIAPRYDLLNRVLSMGIDRGWRKRVVQAVKDVAPSRVLDVATGTGDLAIECVRAGVPQVTGVDIAEEMLVYGREKLNSPDLKGRVTLRYGDAENLPFESDEFDAAMVAFGVRNFEDLDAGLRDMARVLKPGGKLVVLEFSHPTAFPIKQAYGLYSKHILPRVGGWLSGDSGAYRYLPDSIAVFPDGEDFLARMRNAGYRDVAQRRMTFGIASMYTGFAT